MTCWHTTVSPSISYAITLETSFMWRASNLFQSMMRKKPCTNVLCSMSYENCTKKLVVASHKLNAHSSRSHALFSVELECFNQQEVKLFSSRLIMVDLAGSEKIYSSIKEAKTKEESININRSLFSLR